MDSLKTEMGRCNFLEKKQPEIVVQVIQESLDFYIKYLKNLEVELHEIINDNNLLKENFDLLASIMGVSKKTVITLISESQTSKISKQRNNTWIL